VLAENPQIGDKFMSKQIISTNEAPAAIGTYSQATRQGDTVYISGQIPLNPASMEMIEGAVEEQIHRVFLNLQAICESAGGKLDGILKLNVFLTDMAHFPAVNAIMAEYFSEPYPARAAIGVTALPRDAQVEMDASLGL
jgi:reactive intermediate/imine deaminase